MPHIHTEPGQHDMTVSAYVILREEGAWKCLVHLHRKIEKLMQVGGHIELDETPWQSVVHELAEESGYGPAEVKVLQYTADMIAETGNVQHPTPFVMNTHNVGNGHFHSDLCYGFVADGRPKKSVAAGESADVRWLTIGELDKAAEDGGALQDVAYIYRFLLDHLDSYVQIPVDEYSVGKPAQSTLEYKRGAPGI